MKNSHHSDYHKNGYTVIENCLPNYWIDRVFIVVDKMLKQYDTSLSQKTIFKSLNDPDFTKALIKFRKRSPLEFGAMFDAIKLNMQLASLFYSPEIIENVCNILNEEIDGLTCTVPTLRIDVPFDKRSVLDWHQDSPYYPQGKTGDNGVVCWIPMQDSTANNGTPQVLIGSHKEGKLDSNIHQDSKVSAIQHEIDTMSTYKKKYMSKSINTNYGDIGFFNMNLIHRSGTNSSESIRYTAIARYHRITSKDFREVKVSYGIDNR